MIVITGKQQPDATASEFLCQEKRVVVSVLIWIPLAPPLAEFAGKFSWLTFNFFDGIESHRVLAY